MQGGKGHLFGYLGKNRVPGHWAPCRMGLPGRHSHIRQPVVLRLRPLLPLVPWSRGPQSWRETPVLAWPLQGWCPAMRPASHLAGTKRGLDPPWQRACLPPFLAREVLPAPSLVTFLVEPPPAPFGFSSLGKASLPSLQNPLADAAHRVDFLPHQPLWQVVSIVRLRGGRKDLVPEWFRTFLGLGPPKDLFGLLKSKEKIHPLFSPLWPP